MERFTIGRCRSGKIVTSYTDLDELTTFDELLDAMAMLSILAIRELRRDKQSQHAMYLLAEAEKIEKALVDANQWQKQMDAIRAKSAFDLRNHAMRLLRAEFKE